MDFNGKFAEKKNGKFSFSQFHNFESKFFRLAILYIGFAFVLVRHIWF